MNTRSACLLSVCMLASGGSALAQEVETIAPPASTTVLPAITVVAPAHRPKTRAIQSPAPAPSDVASNVPTTRLNVVATTPLAGTGIDADKVPASVTTVSAGEVDRNRSLNVTDTLQQRVPGIVVNEVAGNPFQPDVQFRGFVASPVSGTPQGLAVYQNGVRINEAFGDTVNWDLIPTAAIRSIGVVANNPAFGLNALGGALNIQMKDGFRYHGAEIDTMGGSYGRVQSSAQWGKQVDTNFAVYGALEGLHDDGFRDLSASDVRRFYGDVGYRSESSEFHLNMGAADNIFGATATVPVELLQQNYSAIYTSPQTLTNKVGYMNLTGKVDVAPSWTVEGSAHLRVFDQNTVDGNSTGTQACADPTLLCFGDANTPANGLNGAQLANPFPTGAILGEIDRTTTQSTTSGASLQATNTDQLFGHDNHFVTGGSFDYGVSHFSASAELGTVAPTYAVIGSGIFLGPSGNPTSIGPVGLRTVNQYEGLYVLDTFDVSKAFALTAGGRFNVADITLQDQIGTALNGNATYTRFNPIIGGTYKLSAGLTAYASYSEANRAPTPLELGCADPTHPCILANFLVSDPPLKQVVAKTEEAGLRGSHDFAPGIGSFGWKLGVFRTDSSDDILAIPVPNLQGFGYYQNIGSTRRQGIEAEANLKSRSFEIYANYALVDARFRDALSLGSNSPSADPATGTIQVEPGDQIPAIPRHRLKAGIDYLVTDKLKLGGDMLLVSSQYFVGDASNQQPKLPGYAVFNLHGSYDISKTIQLYARVDNVFDNHYSTYGTFFDTQALPNFTNAGAAFADARSVSPARPRAFYAGMKVTF